MTRTRVTAARAKKIKAQMVKEGLARAATKERSARTGANDRGPWTGRSLEGADAVHCAMAAPDCPPRAKYLIMQLIGAPMDPAEPYWGSLPLDIYLWHYPTHPNYEIHKRARHQARVGGAAEKIGYLRMMAQATQARHPGGFYSERFRRYRDGLDSRTVE